MVSVKNFHRSAGPPPAARRHAGHITHRHKGAGQSLINDFAVSLTCDPVAN
jgi:hypothetical protein